MATREFETQEQADDAFENQMELLQEQSRLRDLISTAEEYVAQYKDDLSAAECELEDLQLELDEVESKIL